MLFKFNLKHILVKRKNILLTGVVMFLMAAYSGAQNTNQYNVIDKNGNKQGYWEKKYPNGKVKYTCNFKDNKPVGLLKRFDEKGNLKAEMNYVKGSDKVYAKLYYPNEVLQAEGYFINKNKDSIWHYYSIDRYLINKVPFVNNKKHGEEHKFYEDGNLYEKCNWENGLKHGLCSRYYQEGKIMSQMAYSRGKLDGVYTIYGLRNNILIQGKYINNKREGSWFYYKDSGEVEAEIKYTNGVADNESELRRLEHERIEQLQKNKGKIKDPRDAMYGL